MYDTCACHIYYTRYSKQAVLYCTHFLQFSLSTFALGLLLILLVLTLHRLHLAGISIADQRVVGNGQCSQVSRMRLTGDEGVRRGLEWDENFEGGWGGEKRREEKGGHRANGMKGTSERVEPHGLHNMTLNINITMHGNANAKNRVGGTTRK